MDVRVGDILLMKKKHPCGGEEFTVTRSGMDFKLVWPHLRPGDHDPPCQGRTPYQKNHPPGGAVVVPYATKFA